MYSIYIITNLCHPINNSYFCIFFFFVSTVQLTQRRYRSFAVDRTINDIFTYAINGNDKKMHIENCNRIRRRQHRPISLCDSFDDSNRPFVRHSSDNFHFHPIPEWAINVFEAQIECNRKLAHDCVLCSMMWQKYDAYPFGWRPTWCDQTKDEFKNGKTNRMYLSHK